MVNSHAEELYDVTDRAALLKIETQGSVLTVGLNPAELSARSHHVADLLQRERAEEEVDDDRSDDLLGERELQIEHGVPHGRIVLGNPGDRCRCRETAMNRRDSECVALNHHAI